MFGLVLANISVTYVVNIDMPCNEYKNISEKEMKIALRARRLAKNELNESIIK